MATRLEGIITEIVHAYSDELKIVTLVSNAQEYSVKGYLAGVFTGFKIQIEGEESQDLLGNPYLEIKRWRVLEYPQDIDNVIEFFQKTALYAALKELPYKKDRMEKLVRKLYEHFGANTIPQFLSDSRKMDRYANFTEGSMTQTRFHLQAEYVNLFDQVASALSKTTPWACRYTEDITKLIWRGQQDDEEAIPYSLEEFLECPYLLIRIPGVINPLVLNDYDFSDADAIAATRGFHKDEPTRLLYGVIYWEQKLMADFGHVYISRDSLIKTAAEKLHVSAEQVEETISDLIEKKILTYFWNRQDKIYLTQYYWDEYNVAKYLLQLKGTEEGQIQNEIDFSLLQDGDLFNEQQLAAIQSAVDNRVTIVTGGPGTGKTTVVHGIIDALKQLGLNNILLAAPTGKASQRLKDATGYEASTIHSMLKIGPDIEYEVAEALEGVDAIIIDEASMISQRLMCLLLKAITPGTHLILVGDKDQLPSIDPGLVFRDIIESHSFSTITLTQNYRQSQDDGSGIISNARSIIEGEYLKYTNCDDFTFFEIEDDQEIADKAVELACEILPRYMNVSVATNAVQVLCPIKRQKVGTYELNKRIQSKVNPRGAIFEVGPDKEDNRRFFIRPGDKVINLFNDKNKMVFNGSIGTAISISDSGAKLNCQFDTDTDNPKAKSFLHREFSTIRVDLAYALSVHKAQGSEYDYVILPFSDSRNLYRNLLYTAITRAKKHLYLIGTEDNLRKGIENTEPMLRNTNLQLWLHQMGKNGIIPLSPAQ